MASPGSSPQSPPQRQSLSPRAVERIEELKKTSPMPKMLPLDPEKRGEAKKVRVVEKRQREFKEKREIFEKGLPTNKDAQTKPKPKMEITETVPQEEFLRRRQLFDQGPAPHIASTTTTTTTTTTSSVPPPRPLAPLPSRGGAEAGVQSPRRVAHGESPAMGEKPAQDSRRSEKPS
jgi:hypothetical protein